MHIALSSQYKEESEESDPTDLTNNTSSLSRSNSSDNNSDLSPSTNSTISGSSGIDTHGGALISPDDGSDWVYEHLAHGPMTKYYADFPDEYDLRKYAAPSRYQGHRGTCAAFAAVTIKEMHEVKENGYGEVLSPEFVYHHRDNAPGSGMYGRDVFRVLQRIGSVPDSLYPYQAEDNQSSKPNKKLYDTANRYRISSYARVTSMDGLKRALLELGPCYLLLPLYSNRPEFWRPAKTPKGLAERSSGGHAVTVVGYNREGFILKNSWGSKWNGDGCIILPYDEWEVNIECWVTIDESTHNELIRSGIYKEQKDTVSNKQKEKISFKKKLYKFIKFF